MTGYAWFQMNINAGELRKVMRKPTLFRLFRSFDVGLFTAGTLTPCVSLCAMPKSNLCIWRGPMQT